MNKTPTFLAAAMLAACASLAARPTTRLAAEWFVPSSTTPNLFALVDAETGVTRIATVSGGAVVTWLHNIPTGTPDVSDVTGGLSGPTGEILAIASLASNRVVLLNVETAAPYPRVVPKIASIGPSGVGTLGDAGSRDLLIASSENGNIPGRLETRLDPAAVLHLAALTNHSIAFRRLQPVAAPGSATAIGIYTATSGSNTNVGLIQRASSSHFVTSKATFTGTLEIVSQIRSISHPGTPWLVGYRPGSASAQLLSLSLPLGTTSTLTNRAITLPFPVSSVMPVTGGGTGPLNEGFLAIAADGLQVRHLRVNAAGNGVEPTGQAFSAEPGTTLAGVAVVPGIGIVKLNATALGAPASSYHAMRWDGSAWVATDSGTIPAVAAASLAPATVLFYDANPATHNAARLLGIQSMPDWTSLTTYPDAFPASIIRETFASPASGLTPAGSASLSPPFGATHIITNQSEPGVSITTLGPVATVFAPDLRIDPPSGSYDHTFQVTAVFDAARHRLRYRRDHGIWRLFDTTVPVAWPVTLQFTLESLADGTRGPIVTRNYALPVATIAAIDSDNDGVPDYVELHYGLDPFGGADSDGDGASDLDEILLGTNPANPLDTPAPGDSLNLSPGGGLSIVATANDHLAREIANGEDVTARALDGALVARAPVTGPFATPLPDGGTRGAILQANTAPSFDELVAISTPLYFNNRTTTDRSGREIIGHIPSDPPPPFAPAYTPGPGVSLAAAASAWRSAALATAASQPPALARTVLHPADAAVSVLLEHLFHTALVAAPPPAEPPPALDAFTFFPARDADIARIAATPAERERLRTLGYDHRRALTLATTARPGMAAAATAFYQRHSTSSATTPGIALPIDALRALLRGHPAPAGYAGAVAPTTLATATAAYQNALANLATAFRPYATWTIEIPGPPAATGVYQRVGDGVAVAFLNRAGERFILEKGLGLASGTRFSVSGFTDTPPFAGHPTMEITAAVLISRPIASDNDQDGNLLDDEWEKFFFGATGQDPYSEPNGNGFTLLQYFLSGADPRSGGTTPGLPAGLFPYDPFIAAAAAGGYSVDFSFPQEWRNYFIFHIERSSTLEAGSFVTLPGILITPLGGDRLRAHIPAAQAPPGAAFFRIRLALAP